MDAERDCSLLAKSPETKIAHRRPVAKFGLVKRALVKTARRVVPARGNRLLRHGVMTTVVREQVQVVRVRVQVVRGLVRRGKVARHVKVVLVAPANEVLAIVHPVARFVVPAVRGWDPA